MRSHDDSTCHELDDYDKKCLQGNWDPNYDLFCYNPVESTSIDEDCLYITESTAFANSCPSERYFHNGSTSTYVWAGRYQDKCVTRFKKKLRIVDCNSRYPHICLYRK